MLRSVFSVRLSGPTARALSTQAIQPPKTPVNLGHLADNAGAVSEVYLLFSSSVCLCLETNII
jgi:large subunit ribosomal protein L15